MRKLVVILAATALLFAFTVPAMAAEWSFYGSARMWTEWEDFDAKAMTSGFDEEELIWTLQSNSRIGARVQAGDIGGRFEYGTGINLRLLYGTYNFGAGTITFGQDYTPLDLIVSDQCGLGGGDCGLIGWGTTYTGRKPKLGLSMGGFSVALRDPSVSQVLSAETSTVVATTVGPAVKVSGGPFSSVETDQTLPYLEAGYSFTFGPAAIMLAGGYGTYDVVGVLGGVEKEYSVDSWALALAFKMGFGPLYVNGGFATGENFKNFGLALDSRIQASGAKYDATADAIADAETMMYYVLVGFKVSDMLKLEGGYSIVSSEIDVANVTTEHEVNTWYIQAAISPVKNMFIIPEIGVVDYGEVEVGGVDTEAGDVTYFGVKWQINF